MSGRVCYLGRADRGDTLALVRLAGVNSEETWEGPAPADDPAEVRQRITEAAAWAAERAMRGDGPRGEIALLCVDVEGSTCAWLTAPSSDTSVVAAALSQGGELGGGAPPSSGPWAPATLTEASVQALAPPTERARRNGKTGAAQGQKLAVLAVPDVSARLFIDALDDRGVFVDRAVSLWHALGLAWDPAGPIASASLRGGGEVVASSTPVTAVVVVDPAGRMVWAWSRAGELLAAGTIRLAQDGREQGAAVVVGPPEAARLTADWIAWSLQIGVAPARLVCVAPPTGDGAGGLTNQELGLALGKAWPGATVDLAVHDDPIGATLHRLAGMDEEPTPADGRLSLVDLSRRPGRAHRAVYRWASLAVLAGAIALLGVAWRGFGAARVAGEERQKLHEEVQTEVSKLAPPTSPLAQAAASDTPVAYLQEQLKKRRDAIAPAAGVGPAMPILQELETLSYVLGNKDVELDQLDLLSSGVGLYIAVPDTKTGEDLVAALHDIEGSHVEWRQPDFARSASATHPGKPQLVTIFGRWKVENMGGGAAGSTGGAGGAP